MIPFICVNYNSYQETIKFINNVLSLGSNCIVIIVDNSPANVSYEMIGKYISDNNLLEKVYLLRRTNEGYFQGLNQGIDFAIKELKIIDSYYVIGNNDIIFDNNFVNNLNDIILSKNDLVLAPDVITNNGSHENPHVITKMSFLRKLKYHIYFSNYSIAKVLEKIKNPNQRPFKQYDSKRKKIHMGIGALYILTPYFFQYFDKLTEEVFLYGEEAVLAGQINSVNGNIIYEPKLICYHNESSTTSKISTKEKYEIIRKSYKIYKKYL